MYTGTLKQLLKIIGACRTAKVPGQRIILPVCFVRWQNISVLIIFISGRGDHI